MYGGRKTYSRAAPPPQTRQELQQWIRSQRRPPPQFNQLFLACQHDSLDDFDLEGNETAKKQDNKTAKKQGGKSKQGGRRRGRKPLAENTLVHNSPLYSSPEQDSFDQLLKDAGSPPKLGSRDPPLSSAVNDSSEPHDLSGALFQSLLSTTSALTTTLPPPPPPSARPRFRGKKNVNFSIRRCPGFIHQSPNPKVVIQRASDVGGVARERASDVITSTPADVCRVRPVEQDWGTNQALVSPVPHAEDRLACSTSLSESPSQENIPPLPDVSAAMKRLEISDSFVNVEKTKKSSRQLRSLSRPKVPASKLSFQSSFLEPSPVVGRFMRRKNKNVSIFGKIDYSAYSDLSPASRPTRQFTRRARNISRLSLKNKHLANTHTSTPTTSVTSPISTISPPIITSPPIFTSPANIKSPANITTHITAPSILPLPSTTRSRSSINFFSCDEDLFETPKSKIERQPVRIEAERNVEANTKGRSVRAAGADETAGSDGVVESSISDTERSLTIHESAKSDGAKEQHPNEIMVLVTQTQTETSKAVVAEDVDGTKQETIENVDETKTSEKSQELNENVSVENTEEIEGDENSGSREISEDIEKSNEIVAVEGIEESKVNESIVEAECGVTGSEKTTPDRELEERATVACEVSEIDVSLACSLEVSLRAPLLPRKSGKGWRRSCYSLAPDKALLRVTGEEARRHTHHRFSIRQSVSSSLRVEGHNVSRGAQCVVGSQPPPDPRTHVLTLCGHPSPPPLTHCFTQQTLDMSKKIGEGVYGEVFLARPDPASLVGARVLKLMPIEGDVEVNGEHQKTFAEIVSEIVISMELSNLRREDREDNWTENFVSVVRAWCVEGAWLPDMLALWDQYHQEKGSENDRPDFFPDSQLHIVLEFGHGGRDLEGYVFNNAGEAVAVFLQIAYGLAVAEQEMEFEHRDLHWGNVLVAATNDKNITFTVASVKCSLPTKGVKATIIDFTLSRLRANGCTLYNDLGQDPDLFTAEGDYQFEIYRQMKKTNGNDWEKFSPYTNVLWLHYILDKMLGGEGGCYYKRTNTKVHKSSLAELRALKGRMLDFQSAADFVFHRELQ